MQKKLVNFFAQRSSLYKQVFISIVFSVFLYVFMEWVFLITKPSFMDIFSFGEKIIILLISSLFIILFVLLLTSLIFLLDVILCHHVKDFYKYAYYMPSALILSCLCLILFDNFTYTLFSFGIVSTTFIFRGLYGLVFLAITVYILRKLSSNIYKSGKSGKWLILSAAGLLTVCIITACISFKPESISDSLGSNSVAEQRPNIILFSTDGLNSDNMSAYGYERDTTPFITELAQTSLQSENNFSNASSSIGSETATLTGKLPLFTRVLITNNTLQEADKYSHLPGILKRNGYRTVSLGVKNYVDVNSINFQNAFDEVNCEANLNDTFSGFAFEEEIYFTKSIGERIIDRLLHIFFIKKMTNSFNEVTNTMTSNISDSKRFKCLLSYLDDAVQSGQPAFIHVHLMGTHGPEFSPKSNTFSKNEEQNEKWMTDFYDDTIVDFDVRVQKLVQYLKDKGLYENTILVIYTDHGQKWSTTTRIPLIIHFPGDQYKGLITENTQNLDIAPTLLDYLGIQQPDWMTSNSLLEPIDSHRLIFGTRAVKNEDSDGNVITDEARIPPFYQFGSVSVIQCQNIFVFDLQHTKVTSTTVKDYPNPCATNTLDSQDVIQENLGDTLMKAGFDLPDVW